MDDRRFAEIVFRAVRDTLLEHGADVSSHPFDRLAVPDQRLWLGVVHRLKIDLFTAQVPAARRRRWRRDP